MPPSRFQLLRECSSLLLALLALAPATSAQTFLTRNYTVADGLPDPEVSDVRRDGQGRVWFATRTGVVTYDGVRWKSVREPDGSQLVDVSGFRFDEHGDAWIVQPNTRVLRGKPGDLAVLPRPDPRAPPGLRTVDFALLQGPAGVRLALATSDHRVWVWSGSAWRAVEAMTPALGAPRTIASWGERLFVGTDTGLWELGPDLRAVRNVALPEGFDPALRGLLFDATGAEEQLWILGRDWIAILDGDGTRLVRSSVPLADNTPGARRILAPDGHGGLFFGNSIALRHFDRTTGVVTGLGRDNGLACEGVKSLFLDGEGLLWVGTRLGASKLVSLEWASYGQRDGFLQDEVSALLELPDGRMLLGHDRGLTLWDGANATPIDLVGDAVETPLGSRVLELVPDGDGSAWIADSLKGLGRLRADRSVAWTALPRKFEDLERWANCVHLDRRGRLWVGASNGLLRVEGGQPVPVDDAQLGDEYIRRIAEAADGRLILGTNRGVWIEGDSKWTHVLPPGRSSPSIYALLVEPDGTTWVGGRGGLWRMHDGQLAVPEPGLRIERAVYSVLRDHAGRLWMGTDQGVLRWDGSRLAAFGQRQGLAGIDTNRSAALVDRRGDVWFGTDSGLSAFRARFERPQAVPAVARLVLVRDGADEEVSDARALRDDERDLRFRAETRSLVDELRLGWRSRLEGFETQWNEHQGGVLYEVRYPHLRAGTYRFEVQVRQGRGPWSAPLSSSSLTVRGPYWTRGWFFALLALAIAALGAGAHWLIAQRRHARLLSAEVQRRSEELLSAQRELARVERLRSLGELAGGIAHDFNNVLTRLMGSLSLLRPHLRGADDPARLLDECDVALERARQLSSQLLTFAKGGEPVIRAVALVPLVQASQQLAMNRSGVRCELDLPADLWPIRADPAQIRQVLDNLLINARQAMPDGGVVHVSARNIEPGHGPLSAARSVRLVLRDQGPGISQDALPRVFEPFFTTKKGGLGLGLATAHSIVQRHLGRMEVSSPPGSGAVFTLHLPASDAVLESTAPRAGASQAGGSQAGGSQPARGPGERILVMDDEPAVRILLEQMLATLGFRVTSTASGEEALQAMSATAGFRCAILDLTIPGRLGGRDALPRLRAFDPALPAIAVSGYTDDAVLARPAEFGFQAALAKPFRLTDLAAALESLLPAPLSSRSRA